MDIKIIVIIILLLGLAAFAVISFVPFKGKKLLCPAPVASNIADSANCSILGYISSSSCPTTSSPAPATAESCKSYVDAAKATTGGATATADTCKTFIDDAKKSWKMTDAECAKQIEPMSLKSTDKGFLGSTLWCDDKYKSLVARSQTCIDADAQLTTITNAMKTIFSSNTYIRKTISTTAGVASYEYKKSPGNTFGISAASPIAVLEMAYGSAKLYNSPESGQNYMGTGVAGENDYGPIRDLFPTATNPLKLSTSWPSYMIAAFKSDKSWNTAVVSATNILFKYQTLNVTNFVNEFLNQYKTTDTTYKGFCV